MSTSFLYHALGARGYHHVSTRYEEGGTIFVLKPAQYRCPKCRRPVTRKGSRIRKLRTVPIGRRPTILEVEVPRVHCARCDLITELDPLFADPYRTYTHALEQYVVDLCRITTIKAAAAFAFVSWDIAKDIEKRRLGKLYGEPSLHGVEYVAIDEIAVKSGHSYLTLAADLKSGRVLYVGEGKRAEALIPFLEKIRRSGVKLRALATDLAPGYALAIRKVLPDVPVVYDRFHVVKRMNDHLEELRRAHIRDTEKARRCAVKGVRFLVLMSGTRLDEHERRYPGSKKRLRDALAVNEPLNKGYYLKEKLRLLWDEPDLESARRLLAEWCEEADASSVRELQRMGRMIANHREGILAYFSHGRITSGLLEGINNKIKTLKRMAYGYRDLEFFKLKILGLHEARYKLVG